MELGRSLAYTPTWSIAAVTTILVGLGFLAQRLIHVFGNWLLKTKRRALLEALEKIKEEWVSKICLKSSVFSSRFYMCSVQDYGGNERRRLLMDAGVQFPNHSFHESWKTKRALAEQSFCPKGHEPFISYESLVQLHHFLFVLGITHVIYCCMSVALTMIKSTDILAVFAKPKFCNYKDLQLEHLGESGKNGNCPKLNRMGLWSWTGRWSSAPRVEKKKMIPSHQSSFVFHHTSHPWSKNKVLIWMKHNLPLTYNFHNYLSRSMEDEFRDIVGLSWLLWAYAILCIFLNFHGTNLYFWLSFIPAILILLVGTKLHHVVVQLALEIVTLDSEFTEMKPTPRDELFWLGKPKLLSWLIQFISFQNAFEMATFIWSLDVLYHFRVVVQFWCSYGVLPLYVLIAQMGSNFKKALISEHVRESLHGWRKRVKRKTRKHHPEARFGAVRSTSFKTVVEEVHADDSIHQSEVTSPNENEFSLQENNRPEDDDPSFDEPIYDTYSDEDDELCLLSP
ncbi:MLO-like protein 4 [Nymphaea thermarum]|nr:MLO-like protein 4 [Nymphaea thermarum]